MTDMREIAPWISRDLLKQINPILPDGQISSCFAGAPVQPLLQKYFRSRLTRIKSISVTVPSHRGAIARRHERGAGCGGRESVRRATAVAGRDEPRERCAACKMIGALADGDGAGVRHPLPAASSRGRNLAG